ncbi:MAG: DUF3644 domain-containing protein [Nitrospiraceae bacterium]
MPRGLSAEVRTHLEKAMESAILAVEVYNKPATKFRSGGYIVLMTIAWTALFHAIFLKRRQKPYYRNDPDNPRSRYKKVEGDYKAWELATCLKKFYGSNNPPERKNLEFFVGLRNKIEHRSMPQLDLKIFGECQAMLFNFEDCLLKECGQKYGLNESLTIALQFSRIQDSEQARAIRVLHRPLHKHIESYIQTFRSSLSNDIESDLAYSYKVFLIPKLAGNQGQADVAVEFVKFDPSTPDQMETYEKIVSLIKPAVIQVANPGKLKAGDVAKAVADATGRKFTASSHHSRAWRFYRIRPPNGDPRPEVTQTQYCQWDEAHRDYVYTDAWKKFLMSEMKDPTKYEHIMHST